jgi:hypothetical protein
MQLDLHGFSKSSFVSREPESLSFFLKVKGEANTNHLIYRTSPVKQASNDPFKDQLRNGTGLCRSLIFNQDFNCLFFHFKKIFYDNNE